MTQPCIEWGVAAEVLPGEAESGDRHLVCAVPKGMLVAAVDGLGHGVEAAAASQAAIDTLGQFAYEPLPKLLRRCHESLRPTRGAVMSLASFDATENTMSWVGVGNVTGLLLRAKPSAPHETLLLRSGVVGAHLPPLQPATVSLARGDVLAFATDGIGNDFMDSVSLDGPMQAIAERVLNRHLKGVDDALVLVVRYRGTDQ
jgi:hypothetical protein